MTQNIVAQKLRRTPLRHRSFRCFKMGRLLLGVSILVIMVAYIDNGTASASFGSTVSNSNATSPQNDETGYTPGLQPLATADLATPAGLAGSSTCQSAGSSNIAVDLSWTDTQSSALDADGNPLLSGYSIWRATSSSGPFTEVGSVSSSGSTQAPTTYTDVNPSGAPVPYAYVANANAGTVSVINTSTNAVTATITLPTPSGGSAPEPDAVAITPNGAYAYVADYANGVVDVIDASTNAITTTITLSGTNAPEPYFIAITPNGAYAYVADYANNQLDVISTSSNAVTGTVSLPAPNGRFTYSPTALAITPNGSYTYATVYVSKQGTAEKGIVDAVDLSNDTTTTIALKTPSGGFAPIPAGIAITPNGCSAYVTDYNNDIVDVIDTSSSTSSTFNAVTKTIALTDAPDLGPDGIAITPNDQTGYVAIYYDWSTGGYTTTVDPLDLANNTLGTAITTGSGPYAVAVQPSTYYYEVQAYHANNWTSPYSSPVVPVILGIVY